jgi:D-alanyl-lipoteichoic acid acyltransferase DltB (MBOAT superfamily)
MLFNSYTFLFAFLPVTLIVFGILGHFGWRTPAFVWLILCSMFFYAYWSRAFLGLLLVSLAVNYLIGTVWLRAADPRLRKAGLIAGLVFNLGALGYFKYAGFLIWNFDRIFGKSFGPVGIVLPLGISFFTFQKIAYLVDTYNGRGYSRNFLYYCLMVLFFPQLIAGPIVHPREVLPQFARRTALGLSAKNLGVGLTLFFFGLAKKVLIADSISSTATRVFAASAAGISPDFASAWLATLAYSLQIYFDFSGYTDMALGLARTFGFRLPVNFNSPYQARNVSDFWRRWHITLSRFLREYLYIPLGGNRRGQLRRYLNLTITMLLGGLWHGTNWTFVAWGGLHAAYLIVHHAWQAYNKHRRGEARRGATSAVWPGALTFLSVAVAWVFFRADNFHAAGRMLLGLFGGHGFDLRQFWIDRARWAPIVPLLALVFWAPNTQKVMSLARPALGVLPPPPSQRSGRLLWRPTALWASIAAVAAIASILYLWRASEFIYYQF